MKWNEEAMTWFNMLKGTREELEDAIKEFNRLYFEWESMRVTGMHPNDEGKFHELGERMAELMQYITSLQEQGEKEE